MKFPIIEIDGVPEGGYEAKLNTAASTALLGQEIGPLVGVGITPEAALSDVISKLGHASLDAITKQE